MAAEVIEVRYAELEDVARCFKLQAEATERLLQHLRGAYTALEKGGWQGLGAEAFSAEMTGRVFPALARLQEALQEGCRATIEVGRALQQAEHDAARLFATGASTGSTKEPTAIDNSAPGTAGGGQIPGARQDLEPEFLKRLDNVAARMKAEGYEAKINSGRRTLDEQVVIFTRGRTFDQFRAGMLEEVNKKHVTLEEAQKWIHYFDPAGGGHPMQAGFKEPVTWTLKSVHLEGRAADVVDAHRGWDAPEGYWDALRRAAEAEGLRIGPPASDRAHVQMDKV